MEALEVAMDKISVIVPVYNVEKYVEKCLESIIRQTYKQLEIIVIDDGSTDASGVICDEFQKKDKRIQVIHQKNQGLSEARNRGIELATGKYLLFVDSDDYISDKLCNDCIQIFKECDVDIVVFGFKAVNIYGKIHSICKVIEQPTVLDRKDAFEYLYKVNMLNGAWNKMYKTKLFESIRYPKGRIFEDLGTTYKVVGQANKVYFTNKVYYYYLIRRPGSIMFQIPPKGQLDLFILEKERYNYFLSKNEEVAKEIFSKVCLSAVQVYIGGAEGRLDKRDVDEAKQYLDNNKEIIKSNRQLMSQWSIKSYYVSPWLCRKVFSFNNNVRKFLKALIIR